MREIKLLWENIIRFLFDNILSYSEEKFSLFILLFREAELGQWNRRVTKSDWINSFAGKSIEYSTLPAREKRWRTYNRKRNRFFFVFLLARAHSSMRIDSMQHARWTFFLTIRFKSDQFIVRLRSEHKCFWPTLSKQSKFI